MGNVTIYKNMLHKRRQRNKSIGVDDKRWKEKWMIVNVYILLITVGARIYGEKR